MSSLAAEAPAPPVATFDDDAWEDLLNFVEEKRVIPIVGPELATVQTDAGPENLYAWLARTLAARLGTSVPAAPHALTLNDVIVRHLANRGRREEPSQRPQALPFTFEHLQQPAHIRAVAVPAQEANVLAEVERRTHAKLGGQPRIRDVRVATT